MIDRYCEDLHKKESASRTLRNKNSFFILVLLIITLPGFLLAIKVIQKTWTHLNRPFEGSVIPPEKPDLSAKALIDGRFQNGFEGYFAYKLPGRELMTRVYNQILFSVFKSSDSSLQYGKDGHWTESRYIMSYFMEPDQEWREELLSKIKIIAKLEKKLIEHNKTFLLLEYPGKPSIYSEYLPQTYRRYAAAKNRGEYNPGPYELLKEYAYQEGISFYENKDLLLKEKENGKIVYQKNNSHWSRPSALRFFNSIILFLNAKSDNKIGTIIVEDTAPIYGGRLSWLEFDGLLLNTIFTWHGFESPQFTVKYNLTDYRPDVFLCGDSYNWSYLNDIFETGPYFFNQFDFCWYNSWIQRYPGGARIADKADDYESIMKNDIIIIEFVESGILPEIEQFIFAENLLNYLNGLDNALDKAVNEAK
jgi:hypothetical protein